LAPYEYTGEFATGSYTQSGGTNSITSALYVGDAGAGSYNLSGSGLLSAVTENIGNSGTGSFTQSGGTHAVGILTLGQNLGSAGTYNLQGGLLTVFSLSQGSGSATFNFSGGTFQAAADLSTSVPITLNVAGSNGVFDTNGHALTLAGPISGPGGLQAEGSGTLILSGENTYGGGTIVTDGTLELLDSSALPGGSSLTVGEDALAIFGDAVPSLHAVPEPTTLALVAAAIWSAGIYSRFRRPKAF